MRIMASAYNKLHGGEYNSVECDGGRCAFRVDDAAFPYTGVADAATILMLECVTITLHGAFCTLTAQDLTPMLLRVQSRRRSPARFGPLAFWSCAVECNALWYSIEYSPAIANLPLARARCSEAGIYNRILGLIEKREAALSERPSFAALVRQTLRDGARSQEEAAARIGVSVATLRRKLLEEGASFRALRREHLNEAAKLGLMHAERIADLADALGFSDPRSFARAFKGWNGRSPQAFRNAARSGR
jgi:AraC-like DNA-binding protein